RYSPTRQVGDAHRTPGYYHRTIVLAYRRPRSQQRVLVQDMSIGMDGHRGHVELRVHRAPVQCLDVLNDVSEAELAAIDFSSSQAIEHEGVVRIRAVPERYSSCFHDHQPTSCAVQVASCMSNLKSATQDSNIQTQTAKRHLDLPTEPKSGRIRRL